MGFAKTVWATVIGGVLLIFISWGLESIKTKLPGWAEAFVDIAWAPVAVPRAVAWITAIAIGFLVVDFYLTTRREAQEKFKRSISLKVKPPSSVFTMPMPSSELSREELAIMDILVHANKGVEFFYLLKTTGINNLRMKHALTNLAHRNFISRETDLADVEHFSLTPDGIAYAVQHNLDKSL